MVLKLQMFIVFFDKDQTKISKNLYSTKNCQQRTKTKSKIAVKMNTSLEN